MDRERLLGLLMCLNCGGHDVDSLMTIYGNGCTGIINGNAGRFGGRAVAVSPFMCAMSTENNSAIFWFCKDAKIFFPRTRGS